MVMRERAESPHVDSSRVCTYIDFCTQLLDLLLQTVHHARGPLTIFHSLLQLIAKLLDGVGELLVLLGLLLQQRSLRTITVQGKQSTT